MRKMSKVAKAEGYNALVTERDVYQRVAHIRFNNVAPDAVETFTDDEGNVYTFQLFECRRANGGIVVHTFCAEGQSVHVQAWLFDDWRDITETIPFGVSEAATMRKLAAERLTVARNRLLDQGLQGLG
jgi:hypothetical protein